MVTMKIAELDASDLERVARYKSTHTQWDVHVSGPLQAIRHLANETQLTIGVAVVAFPGSTGKTKRASSTAEQRPETGGRQPL